MPCMRFEWLGSWPLGKNSFVDMSKFAASVRDLFDMVGSGIEHVLVRGVGKQSLLNGLVSKGRDPCDLWLAGGFGGVTVIPFPWHVVEGIW